MNQELWPYALPPKTSWVMEHLADGVLRLPKPWLEGHRCEATVQLALSRFHSFELPKFVFDLTPAISISELALLFFDLARTLSRYDLEIALALLSAIPLHMDCGPQPDNPILLLSSCMLAKPENTQPIYRITLPGWTEARSECWRSVTRVSLSSFSPSPVMGFPSAITLRPGSLSESSDTETFRIKAARTYIGSLAIHLGMQSGLLQGIQFEAYRYAQERKSFQKSICQHQAVAIRLAEISVNGDSFDLLSRDLLLHLSHELQTGIHELASIRAPIRLLSDFAHEITRDALQVAGGHGYVEGLPFRRSFEQSKAISIMTAQIFH